MTAASPAETPLEEFFRRVAGPDPRPHERLEYMDGKIVDMAGAAFSHERLVAALIRALYDCLKSKGCRVLGSNLFVYSEACNGYYLPDLTLVCGKPELIKRPGAGAEVLLNPAALVEIASPSTALYGRGRKFDCYQKIPSVQQVLLIAPDFFYAEVLTRPAEGGTWTSAITTERLGSFEIQGCRVALADLYEGAEENA